MTPKKSISFWFIRMDSPRLSKRDQIEKEIQEEVKPKTRKKITND